jgi:hypothetical protein
MNIYNLLEVYDLLPLAWLARCARNLAVVSSAYFLVLQCAFCCVAIIIINK